MELQIPTSQEIVLSCSLGATADTGICIWQDTIRVHTHVHPHALVSWKSIGFQI